MPGSSHVLRLLAAVSASALWPALALAQAPASPPAQPPSAQQPAPQQPPAQKGAQQKPATAAPATPGAAVSGVTVQASQAPVRTSIDRRSYSIATDLQTSTGSIADALRNIPGASVDLNGNLTLRGGAVQIMIDGQPSQIFTGPQAGQALQSLPANRIERVEVINNPSAAFSPEGGAGIINLVTKKSAPSGVSGGLRANAGTSGHDNVGGNFIYQAGKLTILGDAGWQQNQYKFRINTTGTVKDRVTGLDDPRTQNETTVAPNRGWNLHGGFTYQLDPKTQLTGDLRYNEGGVNHYDNYRFLTTDPSGTPIAAYSRLGFNFPANQFASEQLVWRRQLPGTDHTLVLFYNHSQLQVHSDSPSDNLTTVPPPPVLLYQDQVAKFRQDIHQFKIDYTRPMPNMGQLKAGYDLRYTDANFNNYASFGSSAAAATLNPNYTNVFRDEQMVNAGYVTYEQPFGDLTVLGGLRVEDEHISLDQKTQSVNVDRDNVGVFPSLHLGYRQNANVTWVANYSLRIQRPAPQLLNPYRNVTDPFNIQVGNPDLKNEETHSFEGGWQYRKGATSYLVTAFYRQSEHTASPVVTDLGAGVLLNTNQNVSSGRVGGLELVAAGSLGKTVTYNVNANFSYTQLETPILGVRQTHEGFNAGGRGSINWQPTKKDLIQVIGIINQGRVTSQGTVDPLLILVAGYRHNFTNEFALVLQTQDPFDTVHQYSRLTGSGLNQRTDLKAHIQTFMIGFTWNFGGNGRPRPPQGFDLGNGGL
ncbi:MAG: TonB-dependent receptor domain-containing protein [Caulobacteraceae bacterium]